MKTTAICIVAVAVLLTNVYVVYTLSARKPNPLRESPVRLTSWSPGNDHGLPKYGSDDGWHDEGQPREFVQDTADSVGEPGAGRLVEPPWVATADDANADVEVGVLHRLRMELTAQPDDMQHYGIASK